MSDTDSLPPTDDQKALLDAVRAVLSPLARLAVAQGVHFGTLEELLKQAMVQAGRQAALEAKPDALPHRLVSRIATSTGINRREVTRLVSQADEPPAPRRSLALELYVHWLTDPLYRDRSGAPAALPRQGKAPSFESLAAEITRDVHHRSLLDEAVRLGLVALDEDESVVRALPDAQVPQGDKVRAMQILGANVGDHLAAAVHNVLGGRERFFEQAIFAHGLSEVTLKAARQLIIQQWRVTFDHLVPALERMIEAGESRGEGGPRYRLRLGQYSFDAPEIPTTTGSPSGPEGDKTDDDAK